MALSSCPVCSHAQIDCSQCAYHHYGRLFLMRLWSLWPPPHFLYSHWINTSTDSGNKVQTTEWSWYIKFSAAQVLVTITFKVPPDRRERHTTLLFFILSCPLFNVCILSTHKLLLLNYFNNICSALMGQTTSSTSTPSREAQKQLVETRQRNRGQNRDKRQLTIRSGANPLKECSQGLVSAKFAKGVFTEQKDLKDDIRIFITTQHLLFNVRENEEVRAEH